MDLSGKIAKAGRFVVCCGQDGRDPLHESDSGILLFRAAAAARTEPLIFGILSGAEEEGVLALGATSRARGTAIDLGGTHGEKERAVGASVAVQGGFPEALGGLRGDGGGWEVLVLRVHGRRVTRCSKAIYPISDSKF